MTDPFKESQRIADEAIKLLDKIGPPQIPKSPFNDQELAKKLAARIEARDRDLISKILDRIESSSDVTATLAAIRKERGVKK